MCAVLPLRVRKHRAHLGGEYSPAAPPLVSLGKTALKRTFSLRDTGNHHPVENRYVDNQQRVAVASLSGIRHLKGRQGKFPLLVNMASGHVAVLKTCDQGSALKRNLYDDTMLQRGCQLSAEVRMIG